MMEKINIQELSAILVEKNHIKKKEAKLFITTLFDLIKKKLESEHIVKVKGLGTFKLIKISARESVDINTGERVVINSHDRISFTPDSLMKELVNKPFSQFETVILNDGVEFDDLKDDDDNAESVAIVDATLSADVPSTENTDDNSESEVETSNYSAPLLDVVDTSDDENYRPHFRWWLYILITIILMAASALGGYYYGSQGNLKRDAAPSVQQAPTDSVISEDTLIADTLKTDTIVAEKNDSMAISTNNPEIRNDVEDKYSMKDNRVRYGAYRIVGTEKEIKVGVGETLSKISKRELGDGMSCYIEVYNDITENTELKAGQIIKIPKLQLKKKSKK